MLMKKTEDDVHRWKDIPQSWIWRINFDYPRLSTNYQWHFLKIELQQKF